ncbi:MAG TPA: M28 family peptidase, partial [Anaerolineales bacterium]|nr:M28 family peptidase [Anaerolineales bacterium]
FSDSEEVGMLGAGAFVFRHPWAKDVGVVLNFDARGSGGPVIMYETSDKNGWLIKEFAKAAPHPVANSLMAAFYKLMPNKTDFAMFREKDLAGLNFAHIVGLNHYHNPLDNLTNIDHRTLQHQGATALALTRHFGNLNLTSTADHNEVYFDVLNSTLITYSEQWVVPLALVVLLIFVAVVAAGFKNKQLTVNGLLISLTAVPLSVIGTVLLLFPTKALLQMAVPSEVNNLWMALLIVITIGVLLVINGLLGRVVGVANLITGGYLWSLILLVLTGLFLKGGSYLFTWSLLFNLVALGFVLAQKRSEITSSKHLLLLVPGAVPGIILFTPLIYLIWVGLTLSSFAALLAIPGMMVLLLGPLTPHFAVVGTLRR